jgi:hypothetical protein
MLVVCSLLASILGYSTNDCLADEPRPSHPLVEKKPGVVRGVVRSIDGRAVSWVRVDAVDAAGVQQRVFTAEDGRLIEPTSDDRWIEAENAPLETLQPPGLSPLRSVALTYPDRTGASAAGASARSAWRWSAKASTATALSGTSVTQA